MKARLAFAIATHLNPDVLLVDEVLAVGDIHFQRKCLNHMRDYLARGGSLVFVSHNTYQIQAVCNRGLLLEDGRVVFQGSAIDAVNMMFERREQLAPVPSAVMNDLPISIVGVDFEPVGSKLIENGSEVRVSVRYGAKEAAKIVWGFSLWTKDLCVCVTGGYNMREATIEPGEGILRCTIPNFPLMPGRYHVRAAICDPATLAPIALHGWSNQAESIDVAGAPSHVQNQQIQMGQLVSAEIIWDH
jgi:hypothetical protein